MSCTGPTLLPLERNSARVLTVRFGGADRSWKAYDGGLVRWMKRELQASP